MYGQKNYLELQGTPSSKYPLKYRISQIGCFLTSFSNLLERFGRGESPVELNRSFREKGIWIDVDDGVRDDLAWSSITRHDSNIKITKTGIGKPSSNNAIVKFTGVSNPFGTHFCLVHNKDEGLIVDSWDGKIKHWNTYGGPKSYAVYEDTKKASTPAPSTPKNSIKVEAGWGISHVAKAAGYSDFREESRWNAIAKLNGHDSYKTFKLYPNQLVIVKGEVEKAPETAPQPSPKPIESNTVNITIQAGWGVSHALKASGYTKEQYSNPAEWERHAKLNGTSTLQPNQVYKVYKKPLEIAKPVVEEKAPDPDMVEPVKETPKVEDDTKVEVKVIPTDPKAYRDTFEEEDRVYIALVSQLIKDVDGLHIEKQLVKGARVNSGGRFVKKNESGEEVVYIRTKKSIEDGIWYGVPETILSLGQDPDAYVGPLPDDEDDDDMFNLDLAKETKEMMNNLSVREKIVALLAQIQGFFNRIFDSITNKKEK